MRFSLFVIIVFCHVEVFSNFCTAQDSKEPLKLSSPDIRKAYSKLPPAAKKTIDRLNELIKKKDYSSNEDILQKAITTHRSLFDETLLGDFMLGYVLEHNSYPMGILKKNGFTAKSQRSLSANYFLLGDASTRASYVKLLAKINESGKPDPSKLTDEERSTAAIIERELVAAGIEKPFFGVDIGKLDAEAQQKMEKAFADDVAAIVKSEPGSNVLDLTRQSIKREFDLKEKAVQVELVRLNKVIMSKNYSMKDDSVSWLLNTYGYILDRNKLEDWVVALSESTPERKEFFEKQYDGLGLKGQKRNRITVSYYEIQDFVGRRLYFEVIRKLYKDGNADFTKLSDEEKKYVKEASHRFP